MDHRENRNDRMRPLGEWALRFFNYSIKKECLIYVTDFTEKELSKNYSYEEIEVIFELIDSVNLLRRIKVREDQFGEAAKLRTERRVPFGDALNAVVARDLSAVVITRDHHFEDLQDIAISKKPEDLV